MIAKDGKSAAGGLPHIILPSVEPFTPFVVVLVWKGQVEDPRVWTGLGAVSRNVTSLMWPMGLGSWELGFGGGEAKA